MASDIQSLHENIPNKIDGEHARHYPRDYEPADVETVPEKTIQSTFEWRRKFWQGPVINLVDGASAPPTEIDGDRYVILELSTSVEHADWDGFSFNDIIQFDDTTDSWYGFTPTSDDNGLILFDKTSGRPWIWNGTAWIRWPFKKAFVELTDAATVAWDYNDGFNSHVTLTDDRALAITNAQDGDYGTIIVIQGSGGSHALSLPSGSQIINTGEGVIALTTDEGAFDILSWVKFGDIFMFSYGLNYTGA